VGLRPKKCIPRTVSMVCLGGLLVKSGSDVLQRLCNGKEKTEFPLTDGAMKRAVGEYWGGMGSGLGRKKT